MVGAAATQTDASSVLVVLGWGGIGRVGAVGLQPSSGLASGGTAGDDDWL